MKCGMRLQASVLLLHIHRSLQSLQRLYTCVTLPELQEERQLVGGTATAELPHRADAHRVQAALPTSFPPDPHTAEEGDRVLRFFCQELGMGEAPLRQWRHKLQQKSAQRWGVPKTPSSLLFPPMSSLSSSQNTPGLHPTAVGGGTTVRCWTRVRDAQAATTSAPSASSAPSSAAYANESVSSSSFLWLRPRLQDIAVVQSAMRNLQFMVSPFLLLSPPPLVAASPPCSGSTDPSAAVPHDAARPASYEECSRWYATRPIPAGMFLMSLPTEAVLFANPPPATDPLITYYMQVEELVGQLVSAVADVTSPHHGYASYLCDSVVPSRNLPFLTTADVQQLFRATTDGSTTQPPQVPAHSADAGDDASEAVDSPALSLMSFFHEDMAGEPLSDYLRTRLSRPEYAWWVSLVLSHRTGTTSLLPMIDKLNHSPFPNCYYTMATEDTMCGIDVLDNLLAGVPGELLYQPYVHVFALRDIPAGAELTLCYASASDGAYKPAGRHLFAQPPSLLAEERSDARRHGSAAIADAGDIEEVMRTLFPHSDVVALAESVGGISGGGANVDSAFASQLRRLQHPGRQEVDTPEGKASWLLQWGFVPPCDALYSAQDLREMATLIVERRVGMRSSLFPRVG
ncbi:putative SET domain containing protein [Leishmania utingensis]|uniref:SET domain containing protein n=1 Tax=Leishmania utingensis TaxID=653362 RepID=A0AAW3APD4_9TRYP